MTAFGGAPAAAYWPCPAAESAAQSLDKRVRLRVVRVVGNNFPWSNSKAFPKTKRAAALTELLDTVETPSSVIRCPVIRDF